MIKVFDVGTHDEAPGLGFPLVTFLEHQNDRLTSPFLKTASVRRYISEDVRDFLATIKYADHPDKKFMLVSALGSDEFWGANRRADAWPEADLSHKGAEYGYTTYTKLGHAFLHHMNKSPDMAKGKVVYASWNPRMHRVEIVKFFKRALAPEVCARADRGDLLKTSMGAKVPYDVCSLCGHKAKTAALHCEHIKKQANEVLSNGHRIRMMNPRPKFFDSSAVTIPAARESGVLAYPDQMEEFKAASFPELHRLSEYEAIVIFNIDLEKEAKEAEDKESYLVKKIDSIAAPVREEKVEDPDWVKDNIDHFTDTLCFVPAAEAMQQAEPLLDEPALKRASVEPLVRLASTFSALGITLRPEEQQYLSLNKMGMGKLASALHRNHLLLDTEPYAGEIGAVPSMSEDFVSQDLVTYMKPWVEKRSAYEPFLSARIETLDATPSWKIANDLIPTELLNREESEKLVGPKGLLALALGYGLYRKMAPPDEKLSILEKSLKRHPWLIPAVFLGGAWGMKMLEKALAPPSRPAPGVKVGSIFWHFVTPMVGAQLLAAGALRKEREGYPLGTMERVVRHYPVAAGLGGVVAARKLTKPLKSLGKAVAKKAANAKVAGTLGDAALSTSLGWYSPYKFPAAVLDMWVFNKLLSNPDEVAPATSENSVVGSPTVRSAGRVHR